MSQQYDVDEDMNQLPEASITKDKIMLTSNINIPNVPATPPCTPTSTPTNSASPSLAERRSRMSVGSIEPLKSSGKYRVPDVIDSIGRRRSTSWCETVPPESPKYIGSPFPINGENTSMRKTQSFFGTIGESYFPSENMEKVNTEVDAKPTGQSAPESKMEIDAEKEVFASMVVDLDSDSYNMDHPRRGYFVILNHDEFESADMNRPGSKMDVEELSATAKFLGFEPVICNNLTYEEIKDYIAKLAAIDHSDADCIAIAVLTHGPVSGYLHSKDLMYPVDKLWTPFTANLCPSLAGKPKLFFIQACRGEKLDGGVTLTKGRTQTDSGANSYKIPIHADFLICYSTVEGYYSWRNPEDGTWFIRSLCNELKTLVPQGKDLLKIMVRVHAKVAFQYQSFHESDAKFNEKKQIPSFVCMLTRDLYFPPKKYQISAGSKS